MAYRRGVCAETRRWQSFWFDLKIVIRQLWLVVEDALAVGDDDR